MDVSAARLLAWLHRMAEALSLLHAMDCVHGDFKPDNIVTLSRSNGVRQPLLIKSRKCEPSCCCRCHLRCPAAGGIPHWRGHHEAGTARRWPGLPGPMVGEAGAALLCTMIACKGPACTASCSAQLLGQLLAGTLHAKDHQGANVSLQLCPQTAGPPASFVTAATAGRLASHRPRQWWTATAANQQVSICCGSMICRRALMWPLA